MVKAYDIVDIVIGDNESISTESRNEIKQVCEAVDKVRETNPDVMVECDAGNSDRVDITVSIPI